MQRLVLIILLHFFLIRHYLHSSFFLFLKILSFISKLFNLFFAWTYTYLVLTLDLCWWPLSKSHTPFVLLWPPQLRQEKSCIVFRSSEVSLRISCLRVMTTYCSLKKSVLHAQRNITLYIYVLLNTRFYSKLIIVMFGLVLNWEVNPWFLKRIVLLLGFISRPGFSSIIILFKKERFYHKIVDILYYYRSTILGPDDSS